jgi:hypothetical protein
MPYAAILVCSIVADESHLIGRFQKVARIAGGWSSRLFIDRILDGAGDGIRTRDINLGKVALYQLSYSRSKRLQVTFSNEFVAKSIHLLVTFGLIVVETSKTVGKPCDSVGI